MAEKTRILRRQLIQEAEGYLELAVVFDDCWPLSEDMRRDLSRCCLDSLAKIADPKGRRAQIDYLRGQALRMLGRFPEAIESLENAWHLESQNVHTCLALGWCYKRTDRLEEAVEAMQLGLTVDPHSAILHYNLACYLALLKRPHPAVKHLSRALELDDSLRELVGQESDFDAIRENPGFMLVASPVA